MGFLTFRNLGIHLGGKEVLTPTSFEVAQGEFVSIIGPSGCGKTTLLRAAAGFVKATTGLVTCGNDTIQKPSKKIAFVFQDYNRALLPWRTVEGNVLLALETAKLSSHDKSQRCKDVLVTVGLWEHSQKFPNQLSGGMQQRLQIARCLAQSPDVMMMDEPFGALDAMTRESLQDALSRLVRAQGLTVLFVTHDLDEAIYLGDKVIALRSHASAEQPSLAAIVAVPIPRPRNQLSTKENPEFLRLRRALYSYLGHV